MCMVLADSEAISSERAKSVALLVSGSRDKTIKVDFFCDFLDVYARKCLLTYKVRVSTMTYIFYMFIRAINRLITRNGGFTD